MCFALETFKYARVGMGRKRCSVESLIFCVVGSIVAASTLVAGFKLNLKPKATKGSERGGQPTTKPVAKLSKRAAAAKVKADHTATIADDALLDPEVKLRQYVKDQLGKGAQKDDITKRLVSVGWDASTIEKLIAEFSRKTTLLTTEEEKLVAFVKEKLALGFSEDALKKSLAKAGWNADVIEKVFTAAKQA